MKIRYLLFLGLVCFCCNNVFAQLAIPKKKCTRGKCYFVDQTGKRISEYYESVKGFKEELAAVKLKDKWGFVNHEMEMVVPSVYDKVGSFSDGLTYAKQDDQYYLIDKKGSIQGERYDSISLRQDYYVVKKGDKFGLLDVVSGNVVEELKFDRVNVVYNGDFGVKLNGKWANYNKGNLDFDNPTIYYGQPEEQPVFSKDCLNSEDLKARNKCSNKRMLETIYRSIRYPGEAREKAIQGTVVIRFNIKPDGRIENAEIVKNLGGGCGEEALGVVKTYLAKWEVPGMDNGEAVNTVFNLPIRFRLE